MDWLKKHLLWKNIVKFYFALFYFILFSRNTQVNTFFKKQILDESQAFPATDY